MSCYVDSVAVWAPGLIHWAQAVSVLTGATTYDNTPVPAPTASVLHAAERRRAPATVRMALHVANEACTQCAAPPAELPCVFASSHGDTEISDYMCAELAHEQPALSPTRFHNSVHNAASGYWTIATHCMQPANAISAGADSFGAGLLEAMLLLGEAPRSLLVAYDMTAPAAIQPLCPISAPFAVALVLARTASANTLAQLQCVATTADASDGQSMLMPDLQSLWQVNPAARCLPLLQALAQRQAVQLKLGAQCWELSPCR